MTAEIIMDPIPPGEDRVVIANGHREQVCGDSCMTGLMHEPPGPASVQRKQVRHCSSRTIRLVTCGMPTTVSSKKGVRGRSRGSISVLAWPAE